MLLVDTILNVSAALLKACFLKACFFGVVSWRVGKMVSFSGPLPLCFRVISNLEN